MALRTRVFSVGKLLLLGGALIATYLLFAAASMRMALRAGEVKVPDLINRTANEATGAGRGAGSVVRDLIGVSGDGAAKVLRAGGLRVGGFGSRRYRGFETGVVRGQRPQAGFQIAPGEPISLEVSR